MTIISAKAQTAQDNRIRGFNLQALSAQKAARQGDGKFGHQAHNESPEVTVGGDAEPQWPEEFGTPMIDFVVSDNGAIVSRFHGEDGSVLEAWGDNDGSFDAHQFDGEGPPLDQDELELIAIPIARQISQQGELARSRGLEAYKHAIVAGITETAPSDEQLADMVARSAEAFRKAEKQRDLSAASLLSRKIRELHPDATQLSIDTGIDDDDVLYIGGVTAHDAAGNELGEYNSWDTRSPLGLDGAQLMSSMTAAGSNAYWAEFSDNEDDHDEWHINLGKAASWVPSFE